MATKPEVVKAAEAAFDVPKGDQLDFFKLQQQLAEAMKAAQELQDKLNNPAMQEQRVTALKKAAIMFHPDNVTRYGEISILGQNFIIYSQL